MTHDPNLNVAHGDPVVPLDLRNWGPVSGGPRPRSALVEPWTPSSSVGWRAYHKAMFPPGGLVTPWVRFKKMSTGVNVARRRISVRIYGGPMRRCTGVIPRMSPPVTPAS
jgi:hypothetical protein